MTELTARQWAEHAADLAKTTNRLVAQPLPATAAEGVAKVKAIDGTNLQAATEALTAIALAVTGPKKHKKAKRTEGTADVCTCGHHKVRHDDLGGGACRMGDNCTKFTPRYNATTEAATPDEASEHSYTAEDYELARWGVKGGANRGIVIEHPEDDSSESKETASEFTSKSEVPLLGRDAYNEGWRDGVDHVKQRLTSDDPYLLGFADGEREFRTWQAAHAASRAEQIAKTHLMRYQRDDHNYWHIACSCGWDSGQCQELSGRVGWCRGQIARHAAYVALTQGGAA